MTTDDTENGWDSLAEDLGITPAPAAAPRADKPAPAPRATPRPAGHRDPRPELEQEADDFASGLADEPQARAALYDPGPETVVDHAADLEETIDPADDGAEGDEPAEHDSAEAGEGGEGGEGGKRRRRRRRRRRKGGPAEAGAEGEPAAEEGGEPAAEAVEEGEAPAPFEGDDDDDEAPPSAVDEEMDAEAAQPRQEWHVMSWNELVTKLHRPG